MPDSGRFEKFGGIRGAIRAGRLLRQGYRQQLNDPSPRVVILNDRSMKIVERARELASDGRDEATAVAELVTLTGRHHHDLRVAVAELRRRTTTGDRTDLRARRVAEAAESGRPVLTETDEEAHRLALLEDWQGLDAEARFTALTTAEPRLADLTNQVRENRLATVIPDGLGPEAAATARIVLPLMRLIGPGSENARDAVLGSRDAYASALHYLTNIRPAD